MNNLLIQVLLVLFFLSCSSKIPDSTVSGGVSHQSVVWGIDELTLNKDFVLAPEIEISLQRLSGEYGPLSYKNYQENESRQREPVVAIITTPAFLRSLSYQDFIKTLNQNNINTPIIIGFDFFAMILALQAVGFSENRVEWELFRLMNKLDNSRPYSRSWTRDVLSFIDDHLSEVKFSDSENKIILPLYDWRERKVLMKDRGEYVKYLKKQFLLNKDRRQSDYISLIEWQAVDLEQAQLGGADIVVYLDGLSALVSFNRSSSYVYGAYLKSAGLFKELEDRVSDDPYALYIKMDFGSLTLDESIMIPDLKRTGREYAKKYLHEIEGIIEKWKNRDNAKF